MDYLGAVNRVLIQNFILKGDDDLVTAFSDNQHEATIRLAQAAITSELNNLSSFFALDYERVTGTLTTVAGQRVYSLPTDFTSFFGTNAYLYLNSDANYRVYEYNGGEDSIRAQDHTYLTNEGYEHWWYWHSSTTKQIALYQIPDDIREYSFEYEKSVAVTAEVDTMPFHSEQEAQAFADMCARRFKYLNGNDPKGLIIVDLENDAEYTFSRQTLFNLMSPKHPQKRYSRQYR